MTSTKTDRIRAALRGERPDRIPFSVWTHLPDDDRDPERLADATYAFFHSADLDIVKTMDNGLYGVEDFGVQPDYADIYTGGRVHPAYTPFREYGDLARLEPVDVEQGAYGRELASLRRLSGLVGDEAPIIFTVFTPLTSVAKLSALGVSGLVAQEDPGPLVHALDVLTEVTSDLVSKALEAGAAGIFFASQVSSYATVGAAAHARYAEPYDLRVLDAAKAGWLNVLHLHGDDLIFTTARDYPVPAVNWHIGSTLPSAGEASLYADKAVIGGIDQADITAGRLNEIRHSVYDVVSATGGRGVIVGAGCTVPHPYDPATIVFAREETDRFGEALARRG